MTKYGFFQLQVLDPVVPRDLRQSLLLAAGLVLLQLGRDRLLLQALGGFSCLDAESHLPSAQGP